MPSRDLCFEDDQSRGCFLEAGGRHAEGAPLPFTHLAERSGRLAGTPDLNFSELFLLIVMHA